MEAPCFVTDIYLPQMLYALTIRSPVAKGRLVSIECPKLPGNYTLIRAKDIPGKNCLENSALPILAAEGLSYIGEPVALLVGPNKNTLEDYSRHCKVIAEEDEPVFSADAEAPGRVAARRDIRSGDPETAFAQAASIVRGSYSSGIQEHWYAEPDSAVAWLEEKEGASKGTFVFVRASTQWPFHVRRSVAQALGFFVSRVTVMPTITGNHMDGKLWYPSLVSCHAALGAWICKRPVRMALTREEVFSFSPKRCSSEISIASAIDEKGEVAGVEINAAVNIGAYGVFADEIVDHVALGSLAFYKTKNIRLSAAAITSNIPPQGPFAGFGLAQGFFAMERHVSCIADKLGEDPAQWRSRNGIKAGMLPPGMPVKDAPAVSDLVNVAMKMSDYRRKWASYELLRQNRRKQSGTGPEASSRLDGDGFEHDTSRRVSWAEKGEGLRGIGIALGYQGNGFLHAGLDKGSYGIEMTLEKDGTLEIKTSMASSGDGNVSLWADAASRILGVDRELVRICYSTEFTDCGPLSMSRNATVITRLVEQGCMDISKKRFRDPLPINVRKTVRPQKNAAWQEYFPNVSDHSGFMRPGWASAVVEVEIDPIQYLPCVRGVWLGIDGGKIISPDRAHKSVKSSAVQALGWAYREHISYSGGAIPPDQYDNFDIPAPSEIPPIAIDFIGSSRDEPKGIGDLPFSCIPAAYVQAVSQAMDHHFQSIPLRALDVWYAGVAKRKKGGQS